MELYVLGKQQYFGGNHYYSENGKIVVFHSEAEASKESEMHLDNYVIIKLIPDWS